MHSDIGGPTEPHRSRQVDRGLLASATTLPDLRRRHSDAVRQRLKVERVSLQIAVQTLYTSLISYRSTAKD